MINDELKTIADYLSELKVPVTMASPHLPDNGLIYSNQAFTELTGYETDEVLYRNCRFLQGELTDQIGSETISRCLKLGVDVSAPILNFKKSGEAFANLVFVNRLTNEAGDEVVLVGCQYEMSNDNLFKSPHRYLEYLNDYFVSGPLCPSALKFSIESKFRLTSNVMSDAGFLALGARHLNEGLQTVGQTVAIN